MRPQAVALTDPADPETAEFIQLRATCRRQELVIEGLTRALARLRRGASALKEENAELRVELDRIRQMAGPR
jgi:regulator of replication initiation timing